MGFRAAALQSPDKPAIVMVESGETVSYGELSERADQYANYFRQLGFEAGDDIAFTLDNDHLSSIKCPKSIDFIEAFPRHATGKLYKRLLKDQYAANAN